MEAQSNIQKGLEMTLWYRDSEKFSLSFSNDTADARGLPELECFPERGNVRARVYEGIGNLMVELSWALQPQGRMGAGLELCPDENHVVLQVATPLGSAFLTIEHDALRRAIAKRTPQPREFCLILDAFEGLLSWKFWGRSYEWDSKTPKWEDGSVDVAKLLFGPSKHKNRQRFEREVDIPLPEGNVRARVRLYEIILKRPRWFARVYNRADIEPVTGVPIPGKGENSWDCGDDAIYSLSCPANSVEEAIGAFVTTVLRDRQRRSGTHLPPSSEAPGSTIETLLRQVRNKKVSLRQAAQKLHELVTVPEGKE